MKLQTTNSPSQPPQSVLLKLMHGPLDSNATTTRVHPAVLLSNRKQPTMSSSPTRLPRSFIFQDRVVEADNITSLACLILGHNFLLINPTLSPTKQQPAASHPHPYSPLSCWKSRFTKGGKWRRRSHAGSEAECTTTHPRPRTKT